MIRSSNKRGRPKGNKVPESSSARVKKHRQALRASGGEIITTSLDHSDIMFMDDFADKCQFPIGTSRSEVIKAMIYVLGGGNYILPGKQISASVTITKRYKVSFLPLPDHYETPPVFCTSSNQDQAAIILFKCYLEQYKTDSGKRAAK